MAQQRHWIDTEDEEAGANRQTASLAGLVVALALVVCGLIVVQALRRSGAEEDCLMSGRTNCDMIIAQLR
jgi:hypothetical protein